MARVGERGPRPRTSRHVLPADGALRGLVTGPSPAERMPARVGGCHWPRGLPRRPPLVWWCGRGPTRRVVAAPPSPRRPRVWVRRARRERFPGPRLTGTVLSVLVSGASGAVTGILAGSSSGRVPCPHSGDGAPGALTGVSRRGPALVPVNSPDSCRGSASLRDVSEVSACAGIRCHPINHLSVFFSSF